MPGVVLQGKLDLATKRPSGLGSNGSYHTGRRTPQGVSFFDGQTRTCRLGTLPAGVLPIVMASSVLDRVLECSDRQATVEAGGFLLGYWCRDRRAGQAYMEMTRYVETANQDSRFSSITFTHDCWSRMHREMAHDHADHQIVGWHHTHPGFGIFLSRHDEFMHRNFFSQPWQVALVVDPQRGELGFFQGLDGEIVDAGFLMQTDRDSACKSTLS